LAGFRKNFGEKEKIFEEKFLKKEILLIKIIFLFFVAKIKNNKKGGDRKWQKKRKL